MAKHIVIIRHGDKNGDQLTPLGESQVVAQAEQLSKKFTFTRYLSSGRNRTNQTISLAISTHQDQPGKFTVLNKFDPTDLFMSFFSEGGLFEAELAKIQELGGTVGSAISISEYARKARRNMITSIVAVASDLEEGQTALVAAHGFSTEMAVPNPHEMPYGIDTADAVYYTVESEEITSAQLIRRPV